MNKTLIWIFAIIITLGAAYFQRKTGPTYPKKAKIAISGSIYEAKLIRSSNNTHDARIMINIPDSSITGKVNYKLFPVEDNWKSIDFVREGDFLIANLPKQPAAGKLEYYATFENLENSSDKFETDHVIIRFKGDVPAWAMIPHILFMFAAMLLSTIAGLFALVKNESQRLYGILTLIFLIIGGFILGPIIQNYAFGEAWTGVPFGWDLTDNKTLIGIVFWVIAVWANYKKQNYRLTIIASVVLFLIYIIPHSLFGSEFDYEQGKVVTGLITGLF
ncbi:MAG: hypothetical protein RBT49_14565 [Bacteroidales bacterium]|jgi:hypothetical protein|nr:hypothetical protein [Bacteroidales bacterium]